MPRNVRNFWIELDVDGVKRTVATGPRSKDGGFFLNVKIRNDGAIEDVVTLSGRADESGNLTLKFLHPKGVVNIERSR